MGIEFDFEHWARLARDNPSVFEMQRQQVIDTSIAGAPEHLQQRLRALQWRLDHARQRAGSPFGACLQLHGLLMEHVAERLLPALEGRLTTPQEEVAKVTSLRPLRFL